MIIGVPKEIKDHEYRVGMIPAGALAFGAAGHRVLVEEGAGLGSGIPNEAYTEAGAELVPDAAAIYGQAEMVVKVKEPLPSEYPLLRRGQTLFTFLHLAPLPELTNALLEREVIGIAYETIEDRQGRLPLLTPMSEVAGRMAVQIGASFLQKAAGGRGTLLAGVPGVPAGDVVVLGGGVVGLNAIKMAFGLGASVTVLDTSLDRLREIDDLFHGAVTTLASNQYNLRTSLRRADLFIGAVLIPGRSAPKLVTREMLSLMKEGAVVVDVAVDQGGCFETTHPTTHSNPTYVIDGVVHYCVANMPGAVPRTSTFALNNATMPYALALANKGVLRAIQEDPGLSLGLNTFHGHITSQPVADSQDRPCVPFHQLM